MEVRHFLFAFCIGAAIKSVFWGGRFKGIHFDAFSTGAFAAAALALAAGWFFLWALKKD